MEEPTVLRTARMGGFVKEDVMTYLDELNSKIVSLEEDLKRAKETGPADSQELTKARNQVDSLQEKLNASNNALRAAKKENDDLKKQIEEDQKVITQIPDEFVDIPMDSLLIEQVLLNLLENAVFHAKGMTELTLSVSLIGDKAVFEVADNGCGIPEDALQKIFTGSYEKSTVPVDGTRSNMGIGLSVCATIVKAHGSEITAGNRKDGGAVFRFALERGGEDDGQ